jgi:hypothetical protein
VASTVGSLAGEQGYLHLARREIWHRSVTLAVIAEAMGSIRGIEGDSCFLCGLLTDIGAAIVAANLERILQRWPDLAPHPLIWWLLLIERFGQPVGRIVAERWMLPAPVRTIISREPATPGSAESDLQEVVAIAQDLTALVGRSARLSPQQVAQIASLRSPNERQRLMDGLDEIIETIAALEGGGAVVEGRESPSLVGATTPGFDGPIRGDLALAFIDVTQPSRRFEVTHITPHRLGVRSRSRLPERYLVQLRSESDLPIQLWAVTQGCYPQEDGYYLELAPFALHGAAGRQWADLVQKYTAVAAAEEGLFFVTPPRGAL